MTTHFEELENKFDELVNRSKIRGLDDEFSALRFDCDHIVLTAENFQSYLYVGNRVGGLYDYRPGKLWVRRFDVEFSKWAYNNNSEHPSIFQIPDDLTTSISRQENNVKHHKNQCLSWARGHLIETKHEIATDRVHDINKSIDDNTFETIFIVYVEHFDFDINDKRSHKIIIRPSWNSKIIDLYDTYHQELLKLDSLQSLLNRLENHTTLDELPIAEVFEISKRTGTIFKFFTDVWFYSVDRSEVIGF